VLQPQEDGGIALGEILQWTPVLNSLSLSRNPLKTATAVAIAVALDRNESLASLALDSAKISDEGGMCVCFRYHVSCLGIGWVVTVLFPAVVSLFMWYRYRILMSTFVA